MQSHGETPNQVSFDELELWLNRTPVVAAVNPLVPLMFW